jgi:hypothetical protein
MSEFEKDLGLELLMNPKKKGTSDALSVSSRSYSASEADTEDIQSVKSIRIMPEIVDIKETSFQKPRSRAPSIYSGDDESYGESQYSGSGSASESLVSSQYESRPRRRDADRDRDSVVNAGHQSRSISDEDVVNAKRELLYQFDRLEKKGFKLPRKFTMASSMEDMKNEFERLKRDRSIDLSVKFQRKTMMTVVSGIELANNYFNPVNAKLEGWSESIHENLDDYDEIFEELHDKYKGKAKMAPEIKLLFMLGGSAFMYHMTNSLFKSSSMPGLDQVLKQNPELMKQFAAATANTMAQDRQNPMNAGLGGMFSNLFSGGIGGLFGGGGNGGGLGGMMGQSAPPPNMRPSMKGPSNVDDILRELETGDNDRVEMMSTVTASEMTELVDDASINNLLMNRRKSKGKNKITLDI